MANNIDYDKWLLSTWEKTSEPEPIDCTENSSNRKLDSLEHEVLKCAECESRENLLRIPELFYEYWCEDCASSLKYDE